MASENKIFNLMEKYLMGPMSKIASWRFVRAIMAAGMASIPFVIVGSMFLVLNVLPETFPFLEGFFNSTFFRISDLYMLANTATMGILALYFGLVVGYEYTKIQAEEEELNLNPLNGALLGMFALFMTIPQLNVTDGELSLVEQTGDSTIIAGWEIAGGAISRLGSSGIFSAIIMAIIAVQLYKLCVKRNFVIKMPESVPDGVSRSFTALIPAFLVAIVVILINGILVALGTDVFQVVAVPFGFVTSITDSWLGVLVIYFLIHALWIVGIHGFNVIWVGFLTPIILSNMQANVEGANIPLAGEFNNAFVIIGGSGATLGLVVFIAFLAKSKQLKVLGKASIVPGVFNINEPLIFGLPIVYNPFLAIPFFIAPMVTASLAYWTIELQLMAPVIAQMPWPSPVGIGAFISTGGSLVAVLMAVINVIIAFMIWFPFIKNYDNMLVKQEKGEGEII